MCPYREYRMYEMYRSPEMMKWAEDFAKEAKKRLAVRMEKLRKKLVVISSTKVWIIQIFYLTLFHNSRFKAMKKFLITINQIRKAIPNEVYGGILTLAAIAFLLCFTLTIFAP